MSGVALARAQAAWGNPPDWVRALADACDRATQTEVAKRIGRSAALVSNVLTAKYKGDLTAVEQVVRGALMNGVVDCPVVGELASDTCDQHQKAKWSPINPQRIAFYRACRAGCPHSRLASNGGQK